MKIKVKSNGRIKASVIIPTYNRSRSLKRTLESLYCIEFPSEKWEIVIVDNNSIDRTTEVVKRFFNSYKLNYQYIKENRLSFTVARQTGAKYSKGDILIYIDDDVTVERKWLSAILRTFEKDKKIGVVGGPIEPIFEEKPPGWVLRMNGIWLSLFNLGKREQGVERIPGPNFSIKKSILMKTGGFPPDTIGVESDGKPGIVEKIYVGPGDWGLCEKVRKAGYKIIYQPKAIVYHHIPHVRLTEKWWQSRFFGEGCYHAIMDQCRNNYSRLRILINIMTSIIQIFKWLLILCVGRIFIIKRKEIHKFWLWFYYAQIKAWLGMFYYPDMAEELWNIGLRGILPNELNKIKKYSRLLN